jgi:hypothetical protein
MLQDPTDTDPLLASASVLLRRLEALDHAARSRSVEATVFDDIEAAAKQLRRLVARLGGALDVQRPNGVGGNASFSARIARTMLADAAQAEEDPEGGRRRPLGLPQPPPGDAPCLSGQSSVLGLPDLLELLAAQQKTGILTVETATEDIAIHLREGKVVHASSDRAPRGERLGDLLVALGFVTQERLDAFLRGFAGSGRLLGEILATGSVVDAGQLEMALAEQVQRLFNRMFRAEEAQYRFTAMDVDQGQFQRVDMGLRFLLFESARQFDESRQDRA